MSYKRKIGDNHRLRKTYRATRNSCLVGVYYDKRKGRLIRFYQSRNAKYLRRCGSKKVPKSKMVLQHGMYRKVYDYWWKLW